jgi:hypothetical protein
MCIDNLTGKIHLSVNHSRHMARKSLISAWDGTECFYALTVLRKHTRILYYQGGETSIGFSKTVFDIAKASKIQ